MFRINAKQNLNILFPPKINISQHDQKDNNFNNNINNNINININNNNINNNNSYNITKLNNDEIDIYNKQIKKIKIKKKKKKTNIIGLNDINKFKNNESQVKNDNTRKTGYSISLNKNISFKEKNDSQSNDNLNFNNINNFNIINNKIINKEKNNIETHESKDKETKKSKDKMNFIHYLIYLISFAKYHSNIKLYSDFRIRMISEENLIVSNLNINKIIKKYKSENSIINQELENMPKVNFNNI